MSVAAGCSQQRPALSGNFLLSGSGPESRGDAQLPNPVNASSRSNLGLPHRDTPKCVDIKYDIKNTTDGLVLSQIDSMFISLNATSLSIHSSMIVLIHI